jgi:hypothetical protein
VTNSALRELCVREIDRIAGFCRRNCRSGFDATEAVRRIENRGGYASPVGRAVDDRTPDPEEKKFPMIRWPTGFLRRSAPSICRRLDRIAGDVQRLAVFDFSNSLRPVGEERLPDDAIAFTAYRDKGGIIEVNDVGRKPCERGSRTIRRFRNCGRLRAFARDADRRTLTIWPGRVFVSETAFAANPVCVIFGWIANTQPVQT